MKKTFQYPPDYNFSIYYEYDVLIIDADEIAKKLNTASSDQLNIVADQLKEILSENTAANLEVPEDGFSFKVYSEEAEDINNLIAIREPLEEQENDQKSSSIFSIKVKQPITFEVAPSKFTDYSQDTLKAWAEVELQKLLEEWTLSQENSKPKVIIKISKEEPKSPSIVNALIVNNKMEIEVDFE